MDITILKVIHLAGVIGLSSSIGAIIAFSSSGDSCSTASGGCGCKKRASMLHGISLLCLFITGFAILKKPPMEAHWWQIKFLIFLWFGVAPLLAKKKILGPCILMPICLALGILAAYLGVAKPF